MESHSAEVCGSIFSSSASSSARKNKALDIERKQLCGSAEDNFNPDVCKVYILCVYVREGFNIRIFRKIGRNRYAEVLRKMKENIGKRDRSL
jgi:hypothetical protein